MKLLTKAIEKKLLANQYESRGMSPIENEKVVVKLFAPSGSATWWIYSMDKNGDCFGVAQISDREYGYFNIHEITKLRVKPFGLPVERDMYYTPETFGELLWAELIKVSKY